MAKTQMANKLNELFLKRETTLSEFQTRFVMPFAVFVTATVALFSIFMIMRARSTIVDRIESEQLTSTRILAMSLEKSLGGVADTLQAFAKTPFAKAGKPQEAQQAMSGYIGHSSLLTSMFLFDSGGNVLAGTDQGGGLSTAMLQDPCYSKVVKGANSCYSDVKSDQDGGRITYVYVPVFNDGGSLFRVVAGMVPLSAPLIKAPVLGANPGLHGFALLVDHSGTVVINGDPSSKNAQVNLENEAVVKQALSGNKGSVGYSYGKVDMLATFSPVEGAGWAVILQRPTSEIGGVSEFVVLAVLFLLLSTVGAIALAVFQSQGVTRFLFQLTGRIDNLSKGRIDLDMDETEPDGRESYEERAFREQHGEHDREQQKEPSELSSISSSFNQLLKSMRDERKRSEASFKEALETAKYNQSIVDSITDVFMVVGVNMQVQTASGSAAQFCNDDLTMLPGRPLGTLGAAWAQPRITEAVRRAMRENTTVSISDVEMPRKNAPSVNLEIRVYPLNGRTSEKPTGAVIYGIEVSELIAKQDQAKQSEAGFRQVMQYMNDPLLILDCDFGVEWCSLSALKLLRPDGEIKQGEDFRNWVLSGQRSRFEQCAIRALNTGETPQPFEMEMDAGGNRIHVEVSLAQAVAENKRQKIVITLRRVPQTRKIERTALREKDSLEKKIRFLTHAFDSVPIAVALTDVTGRVIQVNKAFERLFKDRRQVFMGKQVGTLHAGDSRFFDLAAVAKAGSQHIETYMKSVDGTRFLADAWATVVPESPSGQGAALLCAFREIGAERANVERSKRDLREDTMESVSREIANRLMAPLSGVVQSLQSLGGNIFSDKNRGIWSAAMHGSKCLNQAVNMLLMFAGEQPLEAGPCRIEDIIEETLSTLDRHGMIPPGLRIECEFAQDIPAMEADADQVKMVIWNLVMNSIQAVECQGEEAAVQINVASRTLKGKQVVLVDILDSGPEFDLNEAQQFFEPFYGNRRGGIGLGLTLSKRAIERHGGRIGMERRDGYTRTSFALPVRLEADAGAGQGGKKHAYLNKN